MVRKKIDDEEINSGTVDNEQDDDGEGDHNGIDGDVDFSNIRR